MSRKVPQTCSTCEFGVASHLFEKQVICTHSASVYRPDGRTIPEGRRRLYQDEEASCPDYTKRKAKVFDE